MTKKKTSEQHKKHQKTCGGIHYITLKKMVEPKISWKKSTLFFRPQKWNRSPELGHPLDVPSQPSLHLLERPSGVSFCYEKCFTVWKTQGSYITIYLFIDWFIYVIFPSFMLGWYTNSRHMNLKWLKITRYKWWLTYDYMLKCCSY